MRRPFANYSWSIALTIVVVLIAALIVGIFEKIRSTESSLAASGEYSGVQYPEDKLNAQVVAFHGYVTPKPLVQETLPPVNLTAITHHHYLADFGRARFGALRLDIVRPVGGQAPVVVTVGERATTSFRVWQASPAEAPHKTRGANFTKTIMLHADTKSVLVEGPLRLRPVARDLPGGLATVFPFRYAEINGVDVSAFKVYQIAVGYPFNDRASTFVSTDKILNRVWDMSKHTIKATSFAGVYVDGNRERKPYEADSYIAQLSNYNLDSDYQLGRHSLEFLLYNPTWPTEWNMFPVLMAYNDYMYSGDLDFLRHIYPKLRGRTLISLERADGLIGTPQEQLSPAQSGLRHIVDWPAVERDNYEQVPVTRGKFLSLSVRSYLYRALSWASARFGLHNAQMYYDACAARASDARYELIPVNTVVNAFHYIALIKMAYLAAALGNKSDEVYYRAKAQAVKDSVHAKLFDYTSGTFVDGEGSRHHSLHANMFPLAFGLVPKAYQKKVVGFIKSKGMAASVYGAQFLLDSLYSAGEQDYAYSLLSSTSDRSWYGMFERTGSTMTTEAWNDRVKPNQDWSHAWGSSPANVIPRWLMGIRPVEPGFARFTVQPQPGPLRHAKITVPTVHGEILADFNASASRFGLKMRVPAGTSAEVHIPIIRGQSQPAEVTINGRQAEIKAENRSLYIGALGPGSYNVVASYKNTSAAGGPRKSPPSPKKRQRVKPTKS